MIKRYSELISLPTFKERYEYLKIGGKVGEDTFGSRRYLNQLFYRSSEWKDHIRPSIIIRDNSCDLAFPDRPIHGRVYIHHLNPISLDDLANVEKNLFDLENLVCVSFDTHQAIHYGDESLLFLDIPERTSGDTSPWKVVKNNESKHT